MNKKDLTKLSVNELTQLKNLITGIIVGKEIDKKRTNTSILTTEISNLLDGTSNRFYASDYYAPDRLYSDISGVKNIRIDEYNEIVFVKIYSPSGYQLPDKIKVRNIKYSIEFTKSKNFEKTLDY